MRIKVQRLYLKIRQLTHNLFFKTVFYQVEIKQQHNQNHKLILTVDEMDKLNHWQNDTDDDGICIEYGNNDLCVYRDILISTTSYPISYGQVYTAPFWRPQLPYPFTVLGYLLLLLIMGVIGITKPSYAPWLWSFSPKTFRDHALLVYVLYYGIVFLRNMTKPFRTLLLSSGPSYRVWNSLGFNMVVLNLIAFGILIF